MIDIEVVFRRPRLATPRADLAVYTEKILTGAVEDRRIVEAGISVLYCSAAEIRRLNLDFRGIDKPTDVLSFPSGEKPYLGDLAICLPICADHAAERGAKLKDEVALMLVHGLLHLLGFDHDTPARERRMWTETDRLLAATARIRKPAIKIS